MRQFSAVRTYRIYLRDALNVLARVHEVEAASDEQARELAVKVLNEQSAYPTAEVWDRARFVCNVRKDTTAPPSAP
ncbi:MAG: hypothetical protein JO166_04530 [Deltaproteobacteria bacterium]|nr:hypothetical protein [Deltaproteobacteria bacterium]